MKSGGAAVASRGIGGKRHRPLNGKGAPGIRSGGVNICVVDLVMGGRDYGLCTGSGNRFVPSILNQVALVARSVMGRPRFIWIPAELINQPAIHLELCVVS